MNVSWKTSGKVPLIGLFERPARLTEQIRQSESALCLYVLREIWKTK